MPACVAVSSAVLARSVNPAEGGIDKWLDRIQVQAALGRLGCTGLGGVVISRLKPADSAGRTGRMGRTGRDGTGRDGTARTDAWGRLNVNKVQLAAPSLRQPSAGQRTADSPEPVRRPDPGYPTLPGSVVLAPQGARTGLSGAEGTRKMLSYTTLVQDGSGRDGTGRDGTRTGRRKQEAGCRMQEAGSRITGPTGLISCITGPTGSLVVLQALRALLLNNRPYGPY